MNQLADPEIPGTGAEPVPEPSAASAVPERLASIPESSAPIPESSQRPVRFLSNVANAVPYRTKDSPCPELSFALNARTVVGVAAPSACKAIGEYWAFAQIASGGMATVHVGYGSAHGKRRTVAIKLLKPAYVEDSEFAAMFASEARLAARIQHPNVVQTLDFVQEQGELALVMDYIPGEALSKLLVMGYRDGNPATPPILRRILADVLRGLHAAHEARDADGNKAHVVHRDVSPQNILVGVDGVARVLDFGIAQAAGRVSFTRDNEVRGKLSYVAPEQLEDGPIDLRADLYSAAVVLWEALTCKRLFQTDDEAATLARVLNLRVPPPSYYNKSVSTELDTVVLKALNRNRELRYQSAWDMARSVAASGPCATRDEVADWVTAVATQKLAERQRLVAAMHGAAIDQPSEYSNHRGDGFGNGAHVSQTNGIYADSLFLASNEGIDGSSEFNGIGFQSTEFPSTENSFADLPMVSDAHLLAPSNTHRLRRRVNNAFIAAGTLLGGAVLGTILVLQGANFLERTEDRPTNLTAERVAPVALVDFAVPSPASAPPSQRQHTLNPAAASPPEIPALVADTVTTVSAPKVAAAEGIQATAEQTNKAVIADGKAPLVKPNDTLARNAPGAVELTAAKKDSTLVPTTDAAGASAKSESARTPTSRPTPAQTNCDPAYTIDASGIKRYKLECL